MNRRLAVQLVSIFVKEETNDFERRLSELLPLIVRQLTRSPSPGQFVRLQRRTAAQEDTLLDHHLYLVLVMLSKLTLHCPALLTNDRYKDQVATLTGKVDEQCHWIG